MKKLIIYLEMRDIRAKKEHSKERRDIIRTYIVCGKKMKTFYLGMKTMNWSYFPKWISTGKQRRFKLFIIEKVMRNIYGCQ